MANFFDLPNELLDKILKNLTSRDLYDLITERVRPEQIINASIDSSENNHPAGSLKRLYQMLRLELFSRRGTEASR